MIPLTKPLALTVAVGLMVAGAARADTFNLRIGSGQPPLLPYVSVVKDHFVPEVTRRVAEETEHTVTFTEAYGGSVAKLPEVLEAIEIGLLDLGVLATIFEPSHMAVHNFGFAVPFGTSDQIIAGRIAKQLYEEFPVFTDAIAGKGQRLLALVASADYTMVTKEPWQTLEDLEGRKIMAGGANLAWVGPLGVTPVQGALPQAYNGLQTGVYDGSIMPLQPIHSFKLYEVAPYVAVMRFGSMPINMLTVNTRTWNRLPDDMQRIITEVAGAYEDRVNALNVARDREALELMAAAGATIFEPSETLRQDWAARLKDLPKSTAADLASRGIDATALFQRYIDLLEETGATAVSQFTVE